LVHAPGGLEAGAASVARVSEAREREGGRIVKLATQVQYAGDIRAAAQEVAAMEAAGLDAVFVPEAYSFDAVSQIGYLASRPKRLGPLDIVAGGMVAIGEHLDAAALRDALRPFIALYVGGMGARGKNFYNDIAAAYGFGDAAREIQEHYLAGRKREAGAAVPARLLEGLTLIGSAGYVRDRVLAFRDAGVTYLNAEPVGPDKVATIAALRAIIDGC
jgi:alkanesulfonate monooxygenase SsuD/methylene tetrahydromethanopterin reductase-like flavin-dependent oxidoreductase (luciferase family)